MRLLQSLLFSLCLGLLALPTQAQDQNQGQNNDFQRGVVAFKAEDYARALTLFDRARAAGNQSSNLAYNRAVTLYRLDRLDAAAEAFETLTEDPQWGDLARYNLGLITQQQGDSRAAQFWYAQVAREADNDRLRQLAEQKLVKMVAEREARAATAGRRALLFSLGLANDSNAANLADELASRADGKEDTYLEALGYGHYYLRGAKDEGTKVYGLFYNRDFQEYDLFNARILGVGLTREQPLGEATGELGARLTHTRVDGQVLADQLTLSGALRRPVSAGRLSASWQSSYFNAGGDYRYIGGWQHQLELAARWVHQSVTFKPSLRWQTNDRKDRETETSRTSYSPTRLSLVADLDWQLNPDWTLQSGVTLSRAEYSGENRMMDLGGVARESQRENDERQWRLGARYSLSRQWSLLGQYQYTVSDDTFDRYDYDKQVLTLKLEYALQ